MKINRKALQLIEKGLSSRTVSKLTESQIDVLHSKLLGEQSKGTTMVSSKNPAASQIAKNLNAQGVNVTMTEKELDEDDTLNITQDPDATDDGMGIFEKENEGGPNPWAICHAQVGPKKTRKFERCVMAVKKQLKEGKNPVSLFLESQIEKIVEKHLPPRITKGDLLKVISETSTTAPVKEPITKPTTKPRTRPAHPGKNPNPGEHPSPKAKKSETKESTTAPVKEPITKPTTKPRTRPAHPGQNPNPGEHPAPKATKISPEQAKDTVIDTIMKLLEK
jgi:hypothetical protein